MEKNTFNIFKLIFMYLIGIQLMSAQTIISYPSFESVDKDKITTNFVGISGNSERTVEAWVKTSSNLYSAVVDWGLKSKGQRFTTVINNNGHLRLEIENSGFTGSTAINDGKWHHIAATYNGELAKLYVDGHYDGEKKLTVDTAPDTFVQFGTRVGGDGLAYHGGLSDVRIWNIARTEAEILQNITTDYTATQKPSSLVAHFPLNEGSTQEIQSSSQLNIGFFGNDATSENNDPYWSKDFNYRGYVIEERPFNMPIEVIGEEGTVEIRL